MRDRRSEGRGIESHSRHHFFHNTICLQSHSNPSRHTGENVSDQDSLVVSMGDGKKRVKGSIPAQRHRKKDSSLNAHSFGSIAARKLLLDSSESSCSPLTDEPISKGFWGKA